MLLPENLGAWKRRKCSVSSPPALAVPEIARHRARIRPAATLENPKRVCFMDSSTLGCGDLDRSLDRIDRGADRVRSTPVTYRHERRPVEGVSRAAARAEIRKDAK